MMMLAALPGAGLLAARIRKRRIAGIMMGIHATIAVSGIAILAAYVFAGWHDENRRQPGIVGQSKGLR